MPLRRALLLALLLSAATHLAMLDVLWVDEAYSMAAGRWMLRGAALYRDIWFDKPPLYAWITLAWGAVAGWPLRLAGTAFAMLNCWLAAMAARRLWGDREAAAATLLTAFFLAFDFPWAVLPLAPDMLTVPFALAAVWLAVSGRPFLAGLAAGGALLANSKAIFLLPVTILFSLAHSARLRSPASASHPSAAVPSPQSFSRSRSLGLQARGGLPGSFVWVFAGCLCLPALATLLLATQGALAAHWRQVWIWGFAYSRDTFVSNPLAEGVRRTASWLGFHAALAIPALLYWWSERNTNRGGRGAPHAPPIALCLAVWLVAALAAVAAGWRFFPRYYAVLLPVLLLPAARGLTLMRPSARLALVALTLAIPAARFGPAYLSTAAGALAHRPQPWRDLAMFEDSRAALRILATHAHVGDTLFVWGYRPEINALANLPPATRFLDSQPLTGVLADRHLTRSDATFTEVARENRRELARTAPSFIVDGLGPYNRALSMDRYPDLAGWISCYTLIGETPGTRIYRRRATVPGRPGDCL